MNKGEMVLSLQKQIWRPALPLAQYEKKRNTKYLNFCLNVVQCNILTMSSKTVPFLFRGQTADYQNNRGTVMEQYNCHHRLTQIPQDSYIPQHSSLFRCMSGQGHDMTGRRLVRRCCRPGCQDKIHLDGQGKLGSLSAPCMTL